MGTKLIAWDTSSRSAALVALESTSASDGAGIRLVAELTLNVDLTHSERLLWGIHQLLEAAGWAPSQLDGVGVGLGPGSFTGLRVGLTTARTLAHTLGKPLIGVSSLAALARPAALYFAGTQNAGSTWLVASTDACKNELFVLSGPAAGILGCVQAPEEGQSNSLWDRQVQEQVMSPQAMVRDLNSKMTQKLNWVAVGEGRSRYREAWNELPLERELVSPFPFSCQIEGRYLGVLVWEAFQAKLYKSALQVYPRYLRASDAELKLKERLMAN